MSGPRVALRDVTDGDRDRLRDWRNQPDVAQWMYTDAVIGPEDHARWFAAALAEIGVPQGEIPLALLSFNIGIEAGQLGFIALCLALAGVSTRFAKKFRPKTLAPPASGRVFAAYAIGSLAAFWLFERLATIAGSST